MGIQSLHHVRHMAEQIVQQNVGGFQAPLETQMEQAVEGVHAVVAVGVGFPDGFGLGVVEPGGMLLAEALHIGDLKQSVIIVGKPGVPRAGSAPGHGVGDGIRVNDVVADVRHQAGQDQLIHAGKALDASQLLRVQSGKALGQKSLLLHRAGNLVQRIQFAAVQPLRDHIITVGLMGRGKPVFQPGQQVGAQRPGAGGQQQMNRQPAQIRRCGKEPVPLPGHGPERLGGVIGGEFLIDRVFLLVQPAAQHSAENLVGLGFRDFTEDGHDRHVQLPRRDGRTAQRGEPFTAVPVVEEGAAAFDCFPQGGGGGNAGFAHPDGNQISAELLAVQFDVQQPVVLQTVIADRGIDQKVAGHIIVIQQLFDREGVAAGERNHSGVVRREVFQLVGKLPLLIIPEDDAAPVKHRQGRSKPAVQVLKDLVGVHGINRLSVSVAGTAFPDAGTCIMP